MMERFLRERTQISLDETLMPERERATLTVTNGHTHIEHDLGGRDMAVRIMGGGEELPEHTGIDTTTLSLPKVSAFHSTKAEIKLHVKPEDITKG